MRQLDEISTYIELLTIGIISVHPLISNMYKLSHFKNEYVSMHISLIFLHLSLQTSEI